MNNGNKTTINAPVAGCDINGDIHPGIEPKSRVAGKVSGHPVDHHFSRVGKMVGMLCMLQAMSAKELSTFYQRLARFYFRREYFNSIIPMLVSFVSRMAPLRLRSEGFFLSARRGLA